MYRADSVRANTLTGNVGKRYRQQKIMSPSNDGLSKEFYVSFFNEIDPYLLQTKCLSF